MSPSTLIFAPPGAALVAPDHERTPADPAASDDGRRLVALLDTVSDVVVRFDRSLRHLYVNAVLERVTGIPAAAFLGRTNEELGMPPALCAAWNAALREVFRTGAPREVSFDFVTADGPRWFDARLSPELGPDGRVESVVGVSRDVTRQRHAELALRASEARFRVLTDHASDLVAVVDADGRIAYASVSCDRGLGYPPEALLGTSAVDVVHPDDRAAAAAVLARVARASGETREIELRARHADGSWRTFVVVARGLIDQPVIGGIVITGRDVTDARRAEAALRASEARFRSLSASSPVGIFESDADGRIAYANPRLQQIFGRGEAELLGFGWTASVHPDDVVALRAGWSTALDAQREYDHEYRVVRPDGAIRWVRGRSAPLHDAAGAVVGAVGTIEDVTARKALAAELERQALRDPLTGLANRALFQQRLQAALSRSASHCRGVAVLFVDLDNFKVVNDNFGHPAGDRLLVKVAERLLGATRGCDTVARLGGDEFAVLLEHARQAGDASVVADRIVASMRQPFDLDGPELRITASVGIACAEAAASADELLRNADVAMYRAKSDGKSRHATFSSEMYAMARDRLELEAELPLAVERGEIALLFQPVVELAAGRLAGAEALVRWRHPRRGLLTPDRFIALAEESGAIVPMGRWILHEACREAARWGERPSRSRGERPLSVAVNISGRQLQHAGFVDDVAAALDASGLEPRRLILEVTESVLVVDTEQTRRRLGELKALGVRLAVDDFGTGYSSLAYLLRFPVDVLKIDKAFIAGLARGGKDATLARTIVALGQTLDLRTVAEGVETADQEQHLRAIGCHFGQGYHYARPMEAAALRTMIAEEAR